MIYLFVFIGVFILEELIMFRNKKDIPEVLYIKSKYKIDESKEKLLSHIVAIASAIDVIVVFFLSRLTDKMGLKIIIIFVSVLFLIFITFNIIGFLFRKRDK